ncbi:Endoglucanase 24 [Linum perenne]
MRSFEEVIKKLKPPKTPQKEVEAVTKNVEVKKNEFWGWCFLASCLALLVVSCGVYTLITILHRLRPHDRHPSHRPGPIVKDYADALGVAFQFFDVQKSGKITTSGNRIPWRGDSALQDGSERSLDLSKGLYDAGDNVKFGFPMAFTATLLSWSILEYGERMAAVEQLDHARNSLRWITDFLINAHSSPSEFYVQVGDPGIDHECWEKPERMGDQRRPLSQVNASFPGSDVAAEAAAAMASASLVFKQVDPDYSFQLRTNAEELFAFADLYRGAYSVSIPKVSKYYNSTGYGDELLWAASWLYYATRDPSYLKYVTVINGDAFGNWGDPSWFSWDDKHAGTQVLLARMNLFGGDNGVTADENVKLQMYTRMAQALMCQLFPDSPSATAGRTAGGLIWVSEWNPLQYSMASAFLAVLFSDYMATSQVQTLYCDGTTYSSKDLRDFAITQAEYILGKNPMEMSYLVGYGADYPRYVHHRGSSIPVDAKTGCRDGFKWLDSVSPNPNVAVGAVVGGPFKNETFNDDRRNPKQTEPTTYNSALIVGLLSGLLSTGPVAQSFE